MPTRPVIQLPPHLPQAGEFDAVLSLPAVRAAQFRILFDNALTGVAYVHPDGRLMRVNPQFAHMLGYAPSELEGRHWSEFTHPADVDPVAAEVDRVAAGERAYYRLDKRYIHKRGYSVYCEVLATRVEDADGAFVHFVKQAAEIRLPDHNVAVVKDAQGHPVLQPIVPVGEFVVRNWKWIAGVAVPAIGSVVTALGVAVATYYETKAKYEVQSVELKRLQDRVEDKKR